MNGALICKNVASEIGQYAKAASAKTAFEAPATLVVTMILVVALEMRASLFILIQISFAVMTSGLVG